MIISASRRTDIPAFYSRWFMERIRAGSCIVPNPFNNRQRSVIDLSPQNVDVVVFWTRNPRPLLPHLAELEQRGYRFYFQFTLLDYPATLESHTPSLQASLDAFHRLCELTGPEKIIWRYDPIVLSSLTPPDFHLEAYNRLAQSLQGSTRRSVISLADSYRKTRSRMQQLENQGVRFYADDEDTAGILEPLVREMAHTSARYGMQIQSCAEEHDWRHLGIQPGKCIDDELMRQVFDIETGHTKDPSQRPACRCVASRDIGVYDTCLYGCVYCYASKDFGLARQNFERHDPSAPSLLD